MKTKWITPRTEIETFIPNKYIAACWGVACSVDAANQYEISNGYWDNGNVSHDSDHCGDATNQYLYDDNNDGRPDRMEEIRTELGNLPCTIIGRNIHNIEIGDYIFWNTSSGSRTWHHQGRVVGTTSGHPNASI